MRHEASTLVLPYHYMLDMVFQMIVILSKTMTATFSVLNIITYIQIGILFLLLDVTVSF